MSDEEEDYMSDTFLAKLQDVTPSLIKNSSIKRQNEIESKRKQHQQKKSIHEEQKDKLKEGLNKAITSDNKGFAMLSKMGFKPGTSLGKSSTLSTAIKEPIKININNDGRSGLGTQTAVKEIRERQLNNLKRKINASDMTSDEYRKQMREVSDRKQSVWDLHKLQKTCRIVELEHHVKFPIHPWFWPEDRSKKEESSDEEEEDESEKKTELSVSLKCLKNY
jgi:G-patch domain